MYLNTAFLSSDARPKLSEIEKVVERIDNTMEHAPAAKQRASKKAKPKSDKKSSGSDKGRQSKSKQRGKGKQRERKARKRPLKAIDLPTPSRPQPKSSDNKIVCWHCNQEGHIKPDCPLLGPSEKKRKTQRKGKANKRRKNEAYYVRRSKALNEYDDDQEDSDFDDEDDRNVGRPLPAIKRRGKPRKQAQRHVRFIVPSNSNPQHQPPHFHTASGGRRRYILPLHSINTTNTRSHLNDPIKVRLKFEGFDSEEPDGRYIGLVDTGSNTPAMDRSFAISQGFDFYGVRHKFYVTTANGQVLIDECIKIKVECQSEGRSY